MIKREREKIQKMFYLRETKEYDTTSSATHVYHYTNLSLSLSLAI